MSTTYRTESTVHTSEWLARVRLPRVPLPECVLVQGEDHPMQMRFAQGLRGTSPLGTPNPPFISTGARLSLPSTGRMPATTAQRGWFREELR